MTHDFLNDFNISLVLTKPRTESMTQIMSRKVTNQYRISPLLIGQHRFIFDVGGTNAVNSSVDTMRRERVAVAVLEDESSIPINNGLIEPDYLLCFPFCLQSGFDL